MFQTPYQKGITARRAGRGRHENPFIRETTWFEDNFLNIRYSDHEERKKYWYNGWDAEDKAQKEKASQSQTPTSV